MDLWALSILACVLENQRLEERVNYRDLAHRVRSALAMTEAAYLEARRRSKQGQ